MYKYKSNNCRVCGLLHDIEIWGKYGDAPNFEYCYCCGVQFGYQDIDIDTTIEYRRNWLDRFTDWDEPKYRPDNWVLEEQLKQIPSIFLEK